VVILSDLRTCHVLLPRKNVLDLKDRCVVWQCLHIAAAVTS
jgi:hypothetical protein